MADRGERRGTEYATAAKSKPEAVRKSAVNTCRGNHDPKLIPKFAETADR